MNAGASFCRVGIAKAHEDFMHFPEDSDPANAMRHAPRGSVIRTCGSDVKECVHEVYGTNSIF